MIGRVRGTLIYKKPPFLMVEVGGIGYEMQMPLNTFYLLPQIGSEVVLHTHFVVREDTQQLYCFIEDKQKQLFRELIKVNGIGPKAALTILSGIEVNVFIHSVLEGNDALLTSLPGIGKKTAQRLIIEMRGRLENSFEFSMPEFKNELPSAVNDAISALIALGYKPNDAHRLISSHKEKNLSSEELIRLALKNL